MAEKQCESCSKEISNKIPVKRVIQKLDSFFSINDLKGAGEFLEYWEKEGEFLKDNAGLLSVLNEQIGFYRRTNEKEKGINAVNKVLSLLRNGEFKEGFSVGTIYVNCATTLKHFSFPEKALPLYEKAEEIYRKTAHNRPYETSALYNNKASTYVELKDFINGEEYYKKAISLLCEANINKGEVAVSYVNLAHLYFDKDPFSEDVNTCLEKAWELLTDKSIVKDGNYAFICSKCAPSYGFFGQFMRDEYLKNEAEKIYEGH